MKCFISLEYCGILYSLYGSRECLWVALEIDTEYEEQLTVLWDRADLAR